MKLGVERPTISSISTACRSTISTSPRTAPHRRAVRMSDAADHQECGGAGRSSPRPCWRAPRRSSATWRRSAAICCSARAAAISAMSACLQQAAPRLGLPGDRGRQPPARDPRRQRSLRRDPPLRSGRRPRRARRRRRAAAAVGALRGQRRVRSTNSTCFPATRRSARPCCSRARSSPRSCSRRNRRAALALSEGPRPRLVRVRAGLGRGRARRSTAAQITRARIALGGVGTKPWRLPAVEAALAGGPATPELVCRRRRACRRRRPSAAAQRLQDPADARAVVRALTTATAWEEIR